MGHARAWRRTADAERAEHRRCEVGTPITRSTLRRWLKYFRTIFPQTTIWHKLCGLLMPPVAVQRIPLAVLERLGLKRDGPEPALVRCLRLLSGSTF